MSSSREAWERVLAAVEADARRAEALLHTPAEAFIESADANAATEEAAAAGPSGLPAEWLLPAAVELPSLDSMPPVPEELSERILALRAEIMRLQTELAAAIRTLPREQPRRLVAAGAVTQAPSYIDRRL
jgi:hypothetical protein